MSAIDPLQVALVARLKADAGVTAIVAAKVFDGVAPSGTALPYLTVDSFTGLEQGSALGSVGYGHTAAVHAFEADVTGNEAVGALAAAVKAALRAPLTITGHASTRLKLDFETILSEKNVRHQPMRFRTTAMEV